MSFNHLIFSGNVGQEPDTRYLPDGTPVANFTVAHSYRWTDNNGNIQEKPTWLTCVVWGKMVEVVNKFVTKGTPVILSGSLENNNWVDENNKQHREMRLRVVKIDFAGFPVAVDQQKQQQQQRQQQQQGGQPQQRQQQAPAQQQQNQQYGQPQQGNQGQQQTQPPAQQQRHNNENAYANAQNGQSQPQQQQQTPQQTNQAQQYQNAPQQSAPAAAPQPQQNQGFDDFDDEIPF